ncbi:MAG: hypothetical protein ACR2OM_12110 [Aestuariivirgaceae bacterium]
MCGEDVKLEPGDIGQEKQPGPGHNQNPQQVAAYVCDMTSGLKQLALDADMKFLAYLLDMAHIEAFNIVSQDAKKENGEAD